MKIRNWFDHLQKEQKTDVIEKKPSCFFKKKVKKSNQIALGRLAKREPCCRVYPIYIKRAKENRIRKRTKKAHDKSVISFIYVQTIFVFPLGGETQTTKSIHIDRFIDVSSLIQSGYAISFDWPLIILMQSQRFLIKMSTNKDKKAFAIDKRIVQFHHALLSVCLRVVFAFAHRQEQCFRTHILNVICVIHLTQQLNWLMEC